MKRCVAWQDVSRRKERTNERRRELYAEKEEEKKLLGALTCETSAGGLDRAVKVATRALKSVAGRRRMPLLAAVVDQQVALRTAELSSALAATVASLPARSPDRRQAVATIAGVLSAKGAANSIGLPRKYVTSCVARIKEANTRLTAEPVSTAHIGVLEGRFILMFAFSEASMKSGQAPRKTGVTLYTEQPLWRFYMKYRVEFFHLCLLEAYEDPSYDAEVPRVVTEHQANCWAALWWSGQDDFDLVHVFAEREEHCRRERVQQGSQHTRGRPETKHARRDFDPAKWTLVPRSYRVIMGFLLKVSHECSPSLVAVVAANLPGLPGKWCGINIYPTTDPKHCPICEQGPQHQLRFRVLQNKYGNDGATETYAALEAVAEMSKLKKKIEALEAHRRAIGVQASYWQGVERNVMSARRLYAVTMDFVSWFSRNGDKVRDLVMVIVFGNMITYAHSINWGGTAGCDTYFVADVLNHVFRRTTLFEGATDVHLSSDRGSCFDNPRTLYVVSLMRRLCRERGKEFQAIEPHTNFKVAYHGAGRADGGGVSLKGHCTRWELEMGLPGDGPKFVQKVNDGSFRNHNRKTGHRTLAFDFSRVNYGSRVFESVTGPTNATKNLNDLSALKGVSRVEYSWSKDGELVGMDGVVRVRKEPDTGPWIFVDLLHSAYSRRGAMCSACTTHREIPVHHGRSPCPLSEVRAPRAEDVVQPSDARFEGCGEQVSRKPAKPRSRGGVATGPSNLTKPVLKEFLREHGLRTSGNRDELLTRAQGVDGSNSIINGKKSTNSSNDDTLESESDNSDDSDGTEGDEGVDETCPSGEAGYAVHSIDKVRTIRQQTQYQFTWLGEDAATWETRHSYERYGAVDHERGLTRDQIQARCDAIDAELRDARQNGRARRKSRRTS